MSFEDSNSFLFGLNHFASPGTNASNSNEQNHHGNIDRDTGSTSLLDGLSAFGAPATGSNPPTNDQTIGHDIVEGGSFAEQLALWTNANFSFDGPTGHALLGDEEKDKDDKDKEDDQGDADRRAGKRSRKKKNNDDGPNDTPNPGRNAGNGKRNGKDRLRDENQLSEPQSPIEPIQSRDPAGLHGHNYFGQSSSNSKSDRNGMKSPSSFQGQSNGNFPFGAPGPSPFALNGQNGVPASQPSTSGPLDLTSLLALQQLLNSNPLAMASLGSFNGLNPQLGALGNQLSGFGGNLSGPILQQLHSLQQQQQQQQNNGRGSQQNGITSTPLPSPFPGAQFSGFGFPNGNNQAMNGQQAPFGNVSNGFNGTHMHNSMSHSATSSNSENSPGELRSSMDEGKNGEKIRMTAEERAELLSKRALERDTIPPLKLIDTGNPEADAEANKNAIEEDKRRRNTAASARFRQKKKQREAALESHTKELQDQMAELREELEKVRNENQWLKGLIQVRSASDEEKKLGDGKNGSSVEALQAAQQLQALQHAVSTQQAAQAQLQHSGSAINNKTLAGSPNSVQERTRDTGIRPRGVGTQTGLAEESSAAGQKRDRE